MALSTVSGILTRIGMGKLGRLGLEPAERYERERPGELIHIDVKKLGRIAAARARACSAASPRARANGYHRQRHGRSAGSSCTSRSTTAPAWPTSRSSPTRRPTTAIAFLRRAVAFYRPPRHHRRATADRQRLCLPLDRARDRLPRSGHPPPAHPPLPARRPTARPSASSAPCSAAGPTARSTATAQNAPQPLTAGSGTTTISADTAALGHKPPIARLTRANQPARDLQLGPSV